MKILSSRLGIFGKFSRIYDDIQFSDVVLRWYCANNIVIVNRRFLSIIITDGGEFIRTIWHTGHNIPIRANESSFQTQPDRLRVPHERSPHEAIIRLPYLPWALPKHSILPLFRWASKPWEMPYWVPDDYPQNQKAQIKGAEMLNMSAKV